MPDDCLLLLVHSRLERCDPHEVIAARDRVTAIERKGSDE